MFASGWLIQYPSDFWSECCKSLRLFTAFRASILPCWPLLSEIQGGRTTWGSSKRKRLTCNLVQLAPSFQSVVYLRLEERVHRANSWDPCCIHSHFRSPPGTRKFFSVEGCRYHLEAFLDAILNGESAFSRVFQWQSTNYLRSKPQLIVQKLTICIWSKQAFACTLLFMKTTNRPRYER